MIKKVLAAILCMMLLGCCHIFAAEEAFDAASGNDKSFHRQTVNTEESENTDNRNTDVQATPGEKMPQDFMGSFPGDMPENMPEGMPSFGGGQGQQGGMPSFGGGQRQQGGGMPSFEGGFPGGFGGFSGGQGQNGMQQQEPATFASVVKEYLTPIISMILLGFGFIFVIFYKRTKF